MTPPLFAFSMPGGPELIFILVIVLLLFGAKKLPELARGLGQSLGEFKKAREEFEREIHKTAAEVKSAPDKEPFAKPAAEAQAGTIKEPPKTA
ncbi:MAG: twin-arginine translocase TatA/TatE family subunit [Terrimicrobiaceae bacterium]